MPERDVVSWSILIGGYAQRGFCEDAIRVFKEMVKTKEAEPNEATIVNALSACSLISSLSLGQVVHDYINNRADLLVSNVVMNSLSNMYVKCGEIRTAIQVFNKVKYKDAISWTTIINGLALNGLGKQALQLFSLMHVNGVPPDDVTFIGVLSACSHGGLVAKGVMVFEAMWRVHRIVPKMEHCACMVDMYGRAGLVEEAEAFIREMCMDGEDREEGFMWGALLNACRNHGNGEMFERIKQKIVGNVRGVSVGTFALLSNTYVGFDRWDEANKVRDEMRFMGLKKKAGCSWIEVNQSIS
ncbi:pentatricopeptide repeat-containing protein At3g46790, chloroplastic-like [Pistacia vera]|uniref:pentatricopeptide repeat-containing protein At3g46790, chloroplastic-like n=1 Tax=Pistacia vera TaxID=55513 RepID=UPI001262ADE6|nr:pentatricopeptide repeat-containing protein At3g46790, chloroplastic-like [Pistacia vera]